MGALSSSLDPLVVERSGSKRPDSPQAVIDHLFARVPGRTLLNLGAGGTDYVRPGALVVGADLRAPDRALRNVFVVSDAAQLPFSSGTFAGALLKDVIEHVDDPIGVLREVRRVCQASASVVVVTPRAVPRAVWADPTHRRGFTSRALSTALDEAGWHPTGKPRRLGAVPGASRLRLVPHLETILRVPGFGHWFGTNWCVAAATK